MTRKFFTLFFLFGGLVLGFYEYSLGSEDFPPVPPAIISGYIYLNQNLLKNQDGYYIMAIKGLVKLEGRVDLQGRYKLVIPEGKGINSGDIIAVRLCYQGKSISTVQEVQVPEFGYVSIVNLQY